MKTKENFPPHEKGLPPFLNTLCLFKYLTNNLVLLNLLKYQGNLLIVWNIPGCVSGRTVGAWLFIILDENLLPNHLEQLGISAYIYVSFSQSNYRILLECYKVMLLQLNKCCKKSDLIKQTIKHDLKFMCNFIAILLWFFFIFFKTFFFVYFAPYAYAY